MLHFISFFLKKIAHYGKKHSPKESTKIRPSRSGTFPPAAPKFFRRVVRRVAPQSGRSMIEMLAVLAIMGILTVGGIAAYSFAVSKHRANQIYNQVDLRAVASFGNPVVRQTQVGQTYPLAGFDEVVENITYQHKKTSGNGYDIIASHVPERVCRRLQDMTFPVPKSVTLNEADLSSTCGADNTFVFSYDGLSVGKPSSGVDPIDCNCSGCQSCESGTCQDNDNLCGPKEVCVAGSCQCASGYTECGGSCYAACGEGYMRDPVTCDCVCEPQECPEHASWDTATCSCICEDGYDMCGGSCHPVCNSSGMTGERDPDSCACICLEGTNADTCACPEGYIYVDGQCQRLECRDGTTGLTFTCYINGQLCGEYCESDGNFCLWGTCNPTYCEQVPNSQYFLNPKGWGGCQSGNKKCAPVYTSYSSFGFWRCYNDTNLECCDASREFGQCTLGSCYENPCTAYNATFERKVTHYLFGCTFNEQLHCMLSNDERNRWQCFLNGTICNASCEDPLNCPNCELGTCFNGSTFDPISQMCTKDGIYCDNKNCYFDSNKQHTCGDKCILSTGFANCESGLCYDNCPSSTTFGYINTLNKGGCIKDDISCIWEAAAPPAVCYYKGQRCGSKCELDGTNCKTVYLPQCASEGKCVYGQQITVECTCDTNSSAQVGDYCCAPGHSFINGGCTLIDCPDGQVADEGGICKTACKNNAEVLDCICSGTTHTNQFNAKICCDADHAWDETAETCV